MKKLFRCLSRVANSERYSRLRSESPSRDRSCRIDSFGTGKVCRAGVRSSTVPNGHLPVYVGEEMERFVVSAELLNHPVFVQLLNKSAQEYGYEQKGVLRIPCHVLVFERLLEALRVGDESVEDLINSFVR
ncbi:Auxin-responsive protein saur72 [Sarracenia purpurea var. burkii]